VNGALPVVTGIGLSALFVLLWLGGILYVRRMRREMGERHVADQTGHLAQLGDRAHSIEAWLARAAALPEGREPVPAGERDEAKLAELARRHFPHLRVPRPHLHLIGLTGLEKRLLAWVSEHTGLPNPFDALERLTGDPDELARATKEWQSGYAEVVAAIDGLCVATERLHGQWSGELADRFFPLLADYLSQLDALTVARASIVLGAGRERKGDPIDLAVGVRLEAKIGDRVSRGEPVAVLHANDESRLPEAERVLRSGIKLSTAPVAPPPLILERLGASVASPA